MHITKLAIANVRGVSGSWDVAPATMIIGDNFRGKSAILAAIKLGVFGYLPHPRKEKMVPPMELASADKMAIELRLNDGREVLRNWQRDSKGRASSHDEYVGWKGLGPIPEIAPPILLDPKLYFDQSANKRMQFVFWACRLDTTQFSPDAVIAEIKNIKLEQNTEATEAALKALAGTLAGMVAPTIQVWLEQRLTDCLEQQKLVKQTIDRMTKTVGGLTELQVKNPTTLDAELGELDIQLAAKRAELGKMNTEAGALALRLADVERISRHRKAGKELVETELIVREELQGILAMVQRHNAKLAEPKEDHGSVLAAVAASEAATKLTCEEAKDTQRLLVEARGVMLSEKRAAEILVESLDKNIRELVLDRDTDLASANCPTCEAVGTEWKTRVTQRCELKLTPLVEKHKAASGELIRLNASIKDCDATITRADELVTAAKDNYAKAFNNTRKAEQLARDYENGIKQTVNEKALATERAASIQKDLDRIEKAKEFLAANPEQADGELVAAKQDVVMKIDGCQNVIMRLESQRNVAVSERATAISQAQAVSERTKAEAEAAVLKAAVEVIKSFQQRLVDKAFGSMMDTANKFTNGLLSSPLAYKDGEVGRVRYEHGGIWIPHDQFSDTEQIITYAAMSVALAATAEFRLVLIDELTRIRGYRKRQVVERMLELIRDNVIDQFIGVDTETDDGLVPAYYQHPDVAIIHIK